MTSECPHMDKEMGEIEDEANCESGHWWFCCEGQIADKNPAPSAKRINQACSSVSRSSAENLIKPNCLNGLRAALCRSCLYKPYKPMLAELATDPLVSAHEGTVLPPEITVLFSEDFQTQHSV